VNYIKYNAQGDKLCRGPLHSEGVFIPITRFHFHKTGRRAGKPFASCKDCWKIYTHRNLDSGLVPWTQVTPVLDRLLVIYGSKAALCRELGWQRSALSRGFDSILKHKFLKMKKLLDVKEQELRNKIPGYQSSPGEAEVVDSEPLGAVLREWCSEWLMEHPLPRQDPQARHKGAHMGPLQKLSFDTGINIRQVSGICNAEYPTVSLSKADALLTAIGQWDLLGDEIKVYPNPNWSMDRWLSYMEEMGCI
jgi:hypothetical protein